MRPQLAAVVAATAALALGLAISACGEKSEPAVAPPKKVNPSVQSFDITGQWKGRLTQKKLKPFTVDATIRDLKSAKRNTVAYTVINCGGNWSYQGARGNAFHFREVINHGKGGSCKGVGEVTLTPERGDMLDYEFRGGGVVSRGTLHRVG